MQQPAGFAAYSMVLLASGDRYLLLRRAADKRFAPGKWTGLGGRVESSELDDLRESALRELAEEAGLGPAEIRRFSLRRALLHARPGAPLTLLVYFTGEVEQAVTRVSPEGTLSWVAPDQLVALDLIDNAALVIPLLIDDLRRDPEARERVALGAARYAADGALEAIVWV